MREGDEEVEAAVVAGLEEVVAAEVHGKDPVVIGICLGKGAASGTMTGGDERYSPARIGTICVGCKTTIANILQNQTDASSLLCDAILIICAPNAGLIMIITHFDIVIERPFP